MITHNGVELDVQALAILRALRDANDGLTTSEAKARTGIEDNDLVRRRFQKLEDAELVYVNQTNPDADLNHIPPKKAQLTATGVEFVTERDLESGITNDEQAVQRLERIERRLDKIDSRLADLEHAATIEANGDVLRLEETRRMTTAIAQYLADEGADLGAHYPVR